MKTHILTISKTFPATHKRAGEETQFVDKILNAIDNKEFNVKIHTIRSNYPLWEKRIREVQEGKAVLSLRFWSGKPYRSNQIEFLKLDKDSGIGIQIISDFEQISVLVSDSFDDEICPIIRLDNIAKNDGLSFDDFKEWFKKYDLSEPMAIIHFTNFRY